MNRVKTELTSLEDHKTAIHQAISRRAYTLYERDGFKDGLDLDHWFRAERELAVQDWPLSIENGAVTVRIAMEQFSGSQLVISISARSLLILSVLDEVTNTVEETDREILHFISLPVEIDPALVTCELDAGDLALRLPLVESASTISQPPPREGGPVNLEENEHANSPNQCTTMEHHLPEAV
jgi:hypothetical protein